MTEVKDDEHTHEESRTSDDGSGGEASCQAHDSQPTGGEREGQEGRAGWHGWEVSAPIPDYDRDEPEAEPQGTESQEHILSVDGVCSVCGNDEGGYVVFTEARCANLAFCSAACSSLLMKALRLFHREHFG